MRTVVSWMILLVVAVFTSACCESPRYEFPMPTPPDRRCTLGWFDVYSWLCVDHKHVVVYRFRGECGCDKPVEEISACGQLTPFERNGRPGGIVCQPTSLNW